MYSFERYMEKRDALRMSIADAALKMFELLPWNDITRVIDMGCGTGVMALMLARRHNVVITCVDRDEGSLEALRNNSIHSGTDDRIEICHMDLRDVSSPENYFDMIISEGSVQIIGFENALGKWEGMVRKGGYLLIHTDSLEREKREMAISSNGYELMATATITANEWLRLYIGPLMDLIRSISCAGTKDAQLIEQLEQDWKDMSNAIGDADKMESVLYLCKKG
ncbi:class I SAM-dependent methyltransferase [archaeon]|nr:MAG: class I SAM-dependent methyltransferase [archaeon]